MKDDRTGLDRLDLTRNDLTDGIVNMLRLVHTSLDDNPTAGDGIGVTWRLEESTNNSVFEAASLDILSTDIASGAEDIDWRLSTMIAGILTEFLHVDADGGFIVEISPLIVRSADPTTEIMIDNTATDGDPYLSWALSGVRQFSLGVDDGDGDILKLGSTAIGVGTLLEFDTEVRLTDDTNLAFGDDSDFTIVYDAAGDARLEIDPSAPDGVIAIGANNVADIIITGDASTLTWDADGDTDGELIMDGGRIRINDDDTLVFGDSAEASFEYDEDGTNHLRYDGVDMVFDTATQLLFRDDAIHINSSVDGQMDIDADVEVEITSPTFHVVASTEIDFDSDVFSFGTGAAATDVVLNFIGETSSGLLTWMEDEDYFEFADDILVAVAENIYFRDTAIHINSSVDGQLDIDADGEVEVTTPIFQVVASNQVDLDSNTFNLGAGAEVDVAVNFIAASNNGLFTWMEDEDYFEFADEILMSTTEAIYFRDTALLINSSVDGQLDIDADTEVEITAPTVQIAAATALDVDSDAIYFGTGGAGADVVITFVGETNTGVFNWMEDENYFQFDNEILMAVGGNIYFRDVAINISSSTDGQMDIDADGEVEITSPIVQIVASNQFDVDTNTFNFGAGADVDIAVNFVATTSSGLFTWMEDEDYFEYSDDILMTGAEQLYFRDIALTIYSSTDGQLDIDADVEIELTAPTIDIAGLLTLTVDDANNVTVTDVLTITHTTTGVAGPGIGTGLSFGVEDLGGAQQQGSIDVVMTDVTNLTEDADMVLSVIVNGTITEMMRLNADGGIEIGWNTDTDVPLTFMATTNDGLFTWMEDEDYFEFADDILMNTTENIYFRDVAIYINSSVDGQLDIDADGEVEITSPIVQIVASNQFDVDTNTFNLGAGGEVDIAMNFIAASNSGLFTWMEDEDYFEFADDILMSVAEQLYFRDVALTIYSSADGQLDIDADVEVEITTVTLDINSDAIQFGTNAEADIVMSFDAASNDGEFKWMEDEDYFEYTDDILVAIAENIYFRDVDIHINSSVDGQLDIDADVELELTAPTVQIVAATALDIDSDDIYFGTGTAATDVVMNFVGETSSGEFKWMEDEDYFEYTDDILVAIAENIYFRDVDIHINSSVDGQLDIDADGEVEITSPIVQIVASTQLDVDTNTFNLGAGADVDIAMNFIATTNSGLFTWMEDEDYFEFADDILLSVAEQLYFRDVALTIYSSADGQLDIDADVEVEITAPTIDLVGNVDISAGLDVTGAITVTTTVDGVDIAGFNAVQFVAIALDANVANERVLTAGDGIDLTDGGAGGNATLAVDVTDILGNGLSETANDIYVYELRSSDDGEAALTADDDGRLIRPDAEFATKYEWIEDFDDEAAGVQFEAGMVADFWTTAGTNYVAGNATYQEDAGGTIDAVTAGANDDSVTALGLFNWRVDANPIIEARFKVLDITNAFICAGFVEGAFADKAAYDDDIAVVGIDTDNAHGFGVGQIIFVTNDTNAGAIVQDCGVAITADTFITIRIDLTDTEQPRVWVNNTGGVITAANEVAAGSITGTVQAGISVAPYFMVQSLSAAADTFTIDYIKCWQDRA